MSNLLDDMGIAPHGALFNACHHVSAVARYQHRAHMNVLASAQLSCSHFVLQYVIENNIYTTM
jgi:hypothetical protein